MSLVFGSVCSGIEAASVAWLPLGWQCSFMSEIDKFPRAVLKHHYPDTPLHGDFTTIQAGDYRPIDVLVGGTPCQSFSVAGLRGGLDDDRGNLALEYLRLADRLRPRWLVWENVPGVLSSNGGRDFGAILGGMVELGYSVTHRVLDAQYFGLAQRRRRVFVVGYLGDWRRAAAVLFERASLSGHPAPRREARKTAPTIPSRSTGGGGLGTDFDLDGGLISKCLSASRTASGRLDPSAETFVTHALRGEGFDASEDGTGRGTPIIAASPPLTGNPYGDHASREGLEAGSIVVTSAVRRLTPRECERLQGFPDDYTLIPYRRKWAADGPRYKALGNSMAVPVMSWIGRRIQMVENLTAGTEAKPQLPKLLGIAQTGPNLHNKTAA